MPDGMFHLRGDIIPQAENVAKINGVVLVATGSVTSVNGQDGDVTLAAADIGGVTSVNGVTPVDGAVTIPDPTPLAGMLVAVDAVDGTATTFTILHRSPSAAASDPVPAGWVDAYMPLPIDPYLPVGSTVVVPGDGTVGAPPGVYTTTASGPWTAADIMFGQLVRGYVNQALGATDPVEFTFVGTNRDGVPGVTPTNPIDRLDLLLDATAAIEAVATDLATSDADEAVYRRDLQRARTTAQFEPQAFKFTGAGAPPADQNVEAWERTTLGSLPNGIKIRSSAFPRRVPDTWDLRPVADGGDGDYYLERVAETMDGADVGVYDRFEWADMCSDGAFGRVRGEWYWFYEFTPIEGTFTPSSTGESTHRLIVKAPPHPAEGLLIHDTATETATFYARDDAASDHTEPDGSTWRSLGSITHADLGSIDDGNSEPLGVGNHYDGEIYRVSIYDPSDDTVLDELYATDATPGSTSLTSTGGGSWSTASGAIVARQP